MKRFLKIKGSLLGLFMMKGHTFFVACRGP